MLASLLADEWTLRNRHRELQRRREEQFEEIRRLRQSGGVDIDRSASRQFYAGQLNAEMRLVDRNRETLAGQLDLCRQALVEADRAVEILEKLKEKQQAEHRYEQERRAAREMEDVWLARHVHGGRT